MLYNFALLVALRPRIIHLEPPNSGGAAASFGLTTTPISVNVQRMFRLSGNVDRPLLLLRHPTKLANGNSTTSDVQLRCRFYPSKTREKFAKRRRCGGTIGEAAEKAVRYNRLCRGDLT